MKRINSPRDISLLQINKEEVLVIACDSAGGLGQKTQDQIKVSNRILGKYTVKVPLMEVISVGAEVITVVDNLAVEYEPTGREIIAGIKENLALIDKCECLNGSTEENIKTVQTALGITVIGKTNLKTLNRYTSSPKNNIIAAVGLPLVGEKLLQNKSQAVNFDKFLQLKQLNYVDQFLPVGSKGILYEARILAAENNFDLRLIESEPDLEKSAGPAAVVLLSLKEEDFSRLKKDIELPLNKIGRLI
ncbi:alpha-ribazole kinase [Halanaerobium saccharolyticum]|uniref:Alpha-ribazole kinase n=1 Tax=Halanaerobium saccharolyticum TaxID=43595 RepID=A0A4R6LWE8_9FIRM|nr:AIR synthase related protein [Halanaerobium saccharolyticum]TDO92160.1 alpha-ribazole kinase [Halanaerobium saccharolyticum]